MCMSHHPVLGFWASIQMPCKDGQSDKDSQTLAEVPMSKPAGSARSGKCVRVWREQVFRSQAYIYSPAGCPHMPRKQDSATMDHDREEHQTVHDPHVCSRYAPSSLLRIKPTCVSYAMRAVLANQLVLCWASRGGVVVLQNSSHEASASSDSSKHHGFRSNLEKEEAFEVSGYTPHRMKAHLACSGPQPSKTRKLRLQTYAGRAFQAEGIATRCRKPLRHPLPFTRGLLVYLLGNFRSRFQS